MPCLSGFQLITIAMEKTKMVYETSPHSAKLIENSYTKQYGRRFHTFFRGLIQKTDVRH